MGSHFFNVFSNFGFAIPSFSSLEYAGSMFVILLERSLSLLRMTKTALCPIVLFGLVK
jgi:hypothetical protein